MKKATPFLLLVFSFLSFNSDAQVTKLKYLLEYNCDTDLYDVKIKVTEGSATSIGERAQFNAQITIVVPTGSPFKINELYFPLVNNQNYEGTQSMEWNNGPALIAPDGIENFDFYPISPKINPASFYNNIAEGDEVRLFSFSLGDNTEYDSSVRFFDNLNDNNNSTLDISNYSNGFTLGGTQQDYDGNIHRSCNTSTEKIQEESFFMYPNPAAEFVTIEVPNQTKSLKMINMYGQTIKEITKPSVGSQTLSISDVDNGLYTIVLDLGDRLMSKSLTIQ